MARVGIVKADGGIKAGLMEVLGLVGGLDAFVRPGDSVLLKPNLNGEEGFTNTGLAALLIELLRDFGIRLKRFENAHRMRSAQVRRRAILCYRMQSARRTTAKMITDESPCKDRMKLYYRGWNQRKRA
jgi:hypothetical protein